MKRPGDSSAWSPRKIAAAFRQLRRAHGPLPRHAKAPAVNVLINTILSQNTSDVNSDRAYTALRRRFPKWSDILVAGLPSIAAPIRVGGLANIKAQRIQETLRIILEREGRLSLSRLGRLKTPAALDYLTGIPGVGIKTACCVLLFAFHRPVMPVDTHVYRIAGRLGWIGRQTPFAEAHIPIERLTPPRLVLPLHLYLLEHGRKICRPARPDCGRCRLARLCQFHLRMAGLNPA